MKARSERTVLVLAGLVLLGGAVALALNALKNNMSYFFSPSDVATGKAPRDHLFRLGGLVLPGTLQRGQELKVRFTVSDSVKQMDVVYTGILPDLFAEGQGVIAQGRLGADGVFVADEVLAKHDENYMPPEVAAALDKGHEAGVAAMRGGQDQ
jgi:cytochrome c-type biogenesis protein CcmE